MIKVSVKGETEFGLPGNYQEIVIHEPTIEAVLAYFKVDPKVRKYLYPVVNNRMGKPEGPLQEGDKILLQSPYAGG